jgi:hypothetical protein
VLDLCQPGNIVLKPIESGHHADQGALQDGPSKPYGIETHLANHRQGELIMSSASRFVTVVQHVGAAGALAAIMGIGMFGCASTTPTAYQDLSSTSQLKPVKNGPDAFQYTKPNLSFSGYSALIVDPVTIYSGKDGQFGSVSEQGRSAIAQYMQQQFTQILGKKFQISDSAGPHMARLHLTLTGIESSTPVMSIVSHVLPVGLVVNSGLEAAGHNGTFFGSVSYAVELYDANSGELIYASVAKETPHALSISAALGSLDAARAGLRRGANYLCEDLAKIS